MLDELRQAVNAIAIEIQLVEETSALGMVQGFHVIRPAKSIEELQALKATHAEAFRALAGEVHSLTTTSELEAFRRRFAASSVALRQVLPLPTLAAQRYVDAALVGAASHLSRMNSAT